MKVYDLMVAKKTVPSSRHHRGTSRDGRGAIQDVSWGILAREASLGLFTRLFDFEVGRPVLDRTGLTGIYEARPK